MSLATGGSPQVSNFPNGFANGVSIRGLPILSAYPGNVYWVDSVKGANGNPGTFQKPVASIDTAIGLCTANNGDIIAVKAGHAETLAAASAITCDIAGVAIVGMGTGADRPEITFGTLTTASVVVSAANVSIVNVVGIAGIDGLTNPFHIQAAGCWLDIEWQDASSLIEAETVVLTTAAADQLTANLTYLGFTAGNACVAPVKLVGCTNGRIKIDFYGVASTSIVNFITTLSTNILVTGYVYNSGTTDGSKLVVDTIGSSTWYAEIEDGAAGTKFSGGSGSALAADDLSAVGTVATAAATGAVTSTDTLMAYIKQLVTQMGIELDTNTLGAILYGAGGIATFPSGAAAANAVSLAEVLRYTQENIINGAGTALPSGDSLYGVLAGATGITTFPAAAAPANSVSIAEVLREAYDQADKAVTNTTATLVNGTTLFTIAGGPIEILSLVARCVTSNDATASTLQWSADPTDGVAVTISAASASLANVAAGGMVTFQGTTLATAPLVSASGANIGQAVTNGVVVAAGIITSVVGVGSTTGTWQMHMRYRPLARGVTVS